MLSRIFPLLLAGLTTAPLWPQTDPFVGNWKLTKFTDHMNVAKAGANAYVFNFEGSGPEKIVVDGTYQPGVAGTTLSVTPEGPNWKLERKRNGRKMLTATWTLSKDGNALADDFTSFDPHGAPSHIQEVFTRESPGTGFSGSWISDSVAIGSVTILQIRPYNNGRGLSLSVPSEQITVNLIFDGKNVRRIDVRTIEKTRTSNGKVTQTDVYTVSSNLKTLTRAVHVVGRSRPLITVFERQ